MLALALAGGATPAAFGSVQSDPAPAAAAPGGAQRILSLFARQRTGELDDQLLRHDLDELGVSAVGGVFAVLSGIGLPVEGGEPMRLTRGEEAVLLEVMRGWPDHAVLTGIRAALPEEPTLSQQLLAIRLTGETHSPDAMPTLVDLLGGLDREHLQTALATTAARRAWAQVLDPRDRATMASLKVRASKLDPLLLPGLVEALKELESGATVSILSRLAGESLALDPLILDALGSIPSWDELVRDGSVQRLVRPHLDSANVEARRHAALALGALADAEAFPALVTLTEDRDSRVRSAAQKALQAVSGLRRAEETDRWLSWYDREAAWRGRHADMLLEDARRAEPAGAVKALRELSAHPFYRDELGAEIGRIVLARRSEESIVVAACGAIARLGGGAAVPALIELLDSASELVRASALAALRAATGESLADAEEWRELIAPWD
ncbi:MAG: HEAT repeat domain-containing protein [Planctomycetota bacterium]